VPAGTAGAVALAAGCGDRLSVVTPGAGGIAAGATEAASEGEVTDPIVGGGAAGAAGAVAAGAALAALAAATGAALAALAAATSGVAAAAVGVAVAGVLVVDVAVVGELVVFRSDVHATTVRSSGNAMTATIQVFRFIPAPLSRSLIERSGRSTLAGSRGRAQRPRELVAEPGPGLAPPRVMHNESPTREDAPSGSR